MTKQAEVTKADKPADNKKALDKISKSIAKIGKQMAEQSLEVGRLLQEARALHETAGKFLEWAESELGYKKAYVYRLMAVTEKFGDNKDFQGVAIRVLHIVAGLPEDAQKEAAKIAREGELDSKAATALKPKEDKPEEATTNADESGEDSVPFDTPSKPVEVELPSKPAKAEAAPTTKQEPIPEHTERLLGIIEELERKLELASKTKMPHLPQFDHASFCVRLGISLEEASDKKAVRQAYRALVSAGYIASHASHGLLKEALEFLLKEGKDNTLELS